MRKPIHQLGLGNSEIKQDWNIHNLLVNNIIKHLHRERKRTAHRQITAIITISSMAEVLDDSKHPVTRRRIKGNE